MDNNLISTTLQVIPADFFLINEVVSFNVEYQFYSLFNWHSVKDLVGLTGEENYRYTNYQGNTDKSRLDSGSQNYWKFTNHVIIFFIFRKALTWKWKQNSPLRDVNVTATNQIEYTADIILFQWQYNLLPSYM
jgi:hypothetical protein